METFYLYVLQVNAALLVFYLLYRVLFSRDTFLEVRRVFLISVVFLSFVHPLLAFLGQGQQEPPLQTVMLGYAEILTVTASVVAPVETVFTWQHLFLTVWMAGTALLALRMLWQFTLVCRLACRGKKVEWKGKQLIALEEETAPFSFFNWIFVNPAYYEEKDLQEILIHESVHVRQVHSLDMLVSEILCMLFWFNPAVWFLRNEIRQNLEFLADRNVVCSGYNRKNYQYHLLRLSHHMTAVPIVNNFNVSPLKKRIIMMNKKRTSRMSLLKYALLLPVTGLLILAGNAVSWAEKMTDTAEMPLVVSQDSRVEGIVVDEQGQPLPGVTILIKGTTLGSVSGPDGKFSIRGYEKPLLCFSYIGKETIELQCNKNTDIRIIMRPEVQKLEGVEVTSTKNQAKGTDDCFVVVEEMPEFKEGSVQEYLAKNLKYPENAVKRQAEGKVFLTFVIDKEGKVVDPEVIRSVDPDLDQEALRVIAAMPFWKPGKQHGKAVRVKYTLPIQFRLPSKTSNVTLQGKPAAVEGEMPGPQGEVEPGQSSGPSKNQDVVYVVDGEKMPRGFDVNTLSVKDIKSIDVLKGESAIRLYGEEAKDGAILITTTKKKEE